MWGCYAQIVATRDTFGFRRSHLHRSRTIRHRCADMTYTLFKPPTPEERITWEGDTLPLEAAMHTFGADAAAHLSPHSLTRHVSRVARDVSTVLCDSDRECEPLQRALPDLLKVCGISTAWRGCPDACKRTYDSRLHAVLVVH